MMNSLSIDGFRGIRDLTIENLNCVNLIVGDNNCGKTSVLEAIQLFRTAGSGSLANLYRIARQRESLFGVNANSIYDNFICMFPRAEEELRLCISCEYKEQYLRFSVNGKQSRVLIDTNELDRITRKQLEESDDSMEVDAFSGQTEYSIGEKKTEEVIRVNRLTRISGTPLNLKDSIKIVYVSPFEHLRGNVVNRIVRNEDYKQICIKALQLFDPDIEDILIFRSDVGNRPVEYLRHSHLGNMPLSTYGDGIKKVLVLANAIAEAAEGILLIDEIETAIHMKYYDDIFRFIFKACKAFEVQLFITTYSIEAIDGLLATQDYDNQNNEDAITVVTMKRDADRTYSRVLSGRKVAENREAFGFEVRL